MSMQQKPVGIWAAETSAAQEAILANGSYSPEETPISRPGETVAVEQMLKESGEFGFACPMGMFRVGRLVVE